MRSDQALGVAFVAASVLIFAYYATWTVALPFIPADSPLRVLFPLSREWAVWIPATAIAGAVTLGGLYVAITLLTASAKAPAAAAAATAASSAAPAKGRGSARKAKQ